MAKGKIFIGTSGWVYSHWEEIFYPKNLNSKDKLKYFSQHFKTAEINYSFYHLPRPTTYKNWYSQTPGDFLFAVKASRYITHIKRLKGVKTAWKTFIKNALNLNPVRDSSDREKAQKEQISNGVKEKLGPILFQFPSSFKATSENIKRLEKFLEFIRGRASDKFRFAFEFRHKGWCDEKIYNLLKKHNSAWVIADSPHYPKAEELTADFVYVRMHGSKVLFSSKYTKKELKTLAKKIKKWQKQKKDVFVYFNNDAFGYAIENAKTLEALLKGE